MRTLLGTTRFSSGGFDNEIVGAGPFAVDAVILALTTDTDSGVRERAAQLLAAAKNSRSIPPLVSALRDESEGVRRAASEALVRIGMPAVESLIAALQGPNSTARAGAVGVLGKIGAPAVPPLVPLLGSPAQGARGAATEALGKIGEAAFDSLVEALADAKPEVRASAVEALGLARIERAINPLTGALADPDPQTRAKATESLVRIGKNGCAAIGARRDEWVVSGLIAALGNDASRLDPDMCARETLTRIVQTAQQLKDERLLAEVVTASRRLPRAWQAQALRLRAMEGISDPVLIEGWARETDPELAAIAVWRVTNPSLLAELVTKANQPAIAEAAIRRITDQTVLVRVALAGLDKNLRRAAVEGLTDQTALAKVAVSDPETTVRSAAIHRLTDPELLAKLAGELPPSSVRDVAAARLAWLTGRDILNLFDAGALEVEVAGNGIESVRVRLRRRAATTLAVVIPAGAYFVSLDGFYQNMVARRPMVIELKDDDWKEVTVDAACANYSRAIPTAKVGFAITRGSYQAELGRLAAELDALQPGFAVEQAAVWIVTDNAAYSDLRRLVTALGSGGARLIGGSMIGPDDAAKAMWICDRAGIDVTRRRIWRNAQAILGDLTDFASPRVRTWLLEKLGNTLSRG